MKRFITFLILSLIGIVPLQSKAQTWERVATCDRGAAYLEVATWERRQLQLVITDPNIVEYLAKNSWVKPVWNNPNVMVISGASATGGIFSSGAFSLMHMTSSTPTGYSYVADVERKGNGLYVSFYMLDNHSGYGNVTTYPGNWYFRQCN